LPTRRELTGQWATIAAADIYDRADYTRRATTGPNRFERQCLEHAPQVNVRDVLARVPRMSLVRARECARVSGRNCTDTDIWFSAWVAL
jgi:hypothetical protein